MAQKKLKYDSQSRFDEKKGEEKESHSAKQANRTISYLI